MLSLYDRATMAQALTLPLDAQLHALLSARIASLTEAGKPDLADHTHFVIVQPGDEEDDLREEIGFTPTVNPINQIRFGTKGFEPCWSWLQDHGGWFEMIVTVGNSGFAYVLFIQDADGVSSQLLSLCRAHVT